MNNLRKILNGAQHSVDVVSNYDDRYHVDKASQMVAKRPMVTVDSHQNPRGTQDKAQFDIIVTRQTGDITQPLQCAIFGGMYFQSAYAGLVQPATGGSLVVTGGINSAVPTAVRFAHTVGANTDQIDISCNQTNYPSFLQATTNDLFKISNIRYTITDQLNTIQFSQLFQFNNKTLFGKAGQNSVSVGAYKKPEQFQAGIIDIPVNAIIDKGTMIVMNMSHLAAAFPFTVQLSIFVQRFDKYDANVMA